MWLNFILSKIEWIMLFLVSDKLFLLNNFIFCFISFLYIYKFSSSGRVLFINLGSSYLKNFILNIIEFLNKIHANVRYSQKKHR